ncbi:MAG TPA: hypothetical protein VEQ58_17340 [Polyangiaceae bacterium]|nr:hypothetical protein [Polyangiaceae bacterium]
MSAYLPVYCSSCAHASLTPISEQKSELRCSFCEATARVIPGPVYGDGDWLAFAEIDKALAEADLTGTQAGELVDVLQVLLDRGELPQVVVQTMIERLPALANVRPALVNRLPRGLRMLATLLSARTRDASGHLLASHVS